MRRLSAVVVLVFCAVAAPLMAEDADVHTVGVAINPLSWIWARYQIEVGVPITGLLEVGGQVNYWSFDQFVNLFGVEVEDNGPLPVFLTLGATVRVFPAQTASGFFIGGRLMYLSISVPETGESINDVTAGVDVGWRFRWRLQNRLGLYFQSYIGVQRWLTAGDLGGTIGGAFPILPATGVHFGLTF